MLEPRSFWNILKNENLTFFTGVPDSTFKSFLSLINNEKNLTNLIASNECEAIALGAGYYLSTKKIPIIYMQNSGFGKTINPITSLTCKEVYSIPQILFIGWRGEPRKKDEPQHKLMGSCMLKLLESIKIPYMFLSEDLEESKKIIKLMKEKALETSGPVAIIIRKNIFKKILTEKKPSELMSREEAINKIVPCLPKNNLILSTTGKTSRELYEYRTHNNQKHEDFYMVGAMGCTLSVGLSVALNAPEKEIIIFDGDGSTIMQLGSLISVGSYSPKNLSHFIFDNSAYDSTGGQPSLSKKIDFEKIGKGCKYKTVKTINCSKDLILTTKNLEKLSSPRLFIVKIKKGSRPDLGRPSTSPIENKVNFMNKIKNESN